jgi:hypothetical protein
MAQSLVDLDVSSACVLIGGHHQLNAGGGKKIQRCQYRLV